MSAELIRADEESEVVHISHGALSAITKSEIESQLDAAHKYGRSVKRFLDEAIGLATYTKEIAESCIYALPRGKNDDGSRKVITGPSVRLAEICASAYGNMHVGARVVGVEDKEVVSQGVAWDLEKNLRVTIEKRRRITDSKNRRYNDDMITVTGNAAASIALRDSIFRVIPRAYVNAVYDRARAVAVGDASTLVENRQKMFDGLMKMGVTKERVLLRLEKQGVSDVGLDDLATLIGLVNAVRSGETKVDDAFPPNLEPVRGRVNMDDLKAGKEANRGHGQENLESVAGNMPQGGVQTSTPLQSPPQATEPADVDPPAGDANDACALQDFIEIEIAMKAAKVSSRAVAEHVTGTMGFEKFGDLTKGRKSELLRWIQAKARK